MVKKTVNQDDPSVYHLFYADEQGSPGADLTFFEYPGATRGRAGAGWCTGSSTASAARPRSAFWEERLDRRGRRRRARGRRAALRRPRGPRARAGGRRGDRRAADRRRARRPARARAAGLRRRCARTRADAASAARRCCATCSASRAATTAAGRLRGDERGGVYVYDEPPAERGLQGAGTVHHVAWASQTEDHEAWQQRVARGRRAAHAGDRPLLVPLRLLPRAERRAVRDRDDRAPASRPTRIPRTSASSSSLPPRFEPLRDQVEPTLTPLPDRGRDLQRRLDAAERERVGVAVERHPQPDEALERARPARPRARRARRRRRASPSGAR